MIERTQYLEELKRWKDKDLIKVITGIRRCGKSTLFQLFIDYLKSTGISDEQIISINLEDADYNFEDYKQLYDYIKEKMDSKKQYYVFLDEVQNVPMFQKAVDSLYIKKNVDVYITGSNAYLLSGELATLLSGRYIEIKMLPLSFKEYVSAFDDNNYQQLFLNYMKNGGMPGNISILKSNPNDLDKYLDGIFSTIVYKDIMARNNINDKMLLESVLKFIFDSIGSPISTKKISDTLTSKGMSTSNHTVEKYITAFVESFLIYKVERFDVKGKNLLARDYKYYVVDQGLRSYLLGKKADSDMGHILENIVYLELLRRGYRVYVGKVDDLEVDFVAESRDGLKYFQVALTVRDEKVLQRELRSLQKTGDHYPKYLLTLDMDLESDYDGITKINVVDWLLQDNK
ncbi:MAG TPA: ATP-binding protein [Candidatus Onthousia excrementipullorum]|uniref:ATP-binding protein n=1 Tax=Candidatus Onthousia excrementipullorum TaxID=2840884 RepID=A0A9D1DUU9_9FIRM|nr:ATP-binding protein [Candidatus Onthousia excrementipullorum]